MSVPLNVGQRNGEQQVAHPLMRKKAAIHSLTGLLGGGFGVLCCFLVTLNLNFLTVQLTVGDSKVKT